MFKIGIKCHKELDSNHFLIRGAEWGGRSVPLKETYQGSWKFKTFCFYDFTHSLLKKIKHANSSLELCLQIIKAHDCFDINRNLNKFNFNWNFYLYFYFDLYAANCLFPVTIIRSIGFLAADEKPLSIYLVYSSC